MRATALALTVGTQTAPLNRPLQRFTAEMGPPRAALPLLLLLQLALATHYRFGTISYKPIGSDGTVCPRLDVAISEAACALQIEFEIKLAYRRSFSWSWSGAVGDEVHSSGSWSLGDGTSVYSPRLTISGFSEEFDWVFLEVRDCHNMSSEPLRRADGWRCTGEIHAYLLGYKYRLLC